MRSKHEDIDAGTGLMVSHGSFVVCVERSQTTFKHSHIDKSSTSSFGGAAKCNGGEFAFGRCGFGTSGRTPFMGSGMSLYFGGSTEVSTSGIMKPSLETDSKVCLPADPIMLVGDSWCSRVRLEDRPVPAPGISFVASVGAHLGGLVG